MSNATTRDAIDTRKKELAAQNGQDLDLSPTKTAVTIYTLLERDGIITSFAEVLPDGMSVKQLKQDVIAAVKASPDLVKCDPWEIVGAVMSCAQLGLRPGSKLGEAWLLPFQKGGKNGAYYCQLIIGYQGILKLCYQSRIVTNAYTEEVYENDKFRYLRGTSPRLEHEPEYKGPRGKLLGFYAVAQGLDGAPPWFKFVTVADMEEHRDRFAMAKKWNPETKSKDVVGPWKTNFEAMSRKTALIMAMRTMPKSTLMGYALAADNRVRVDRDPDAIGTGWYPGEGDDGQVAPPQSEGTGTAGAGSTVDGDVMASAEQVATLDGWLTDCGLADPAERVRAAVVIAENPGAKSMTELTVDDMAYVMRRVEQARTEADKAGALATVIRDAEENSALKNPPAPDAAAPEGEQ